MIPDAFLMPEFVAEIVATCRACRPLTELNVIRHEPDNRFLGLRGNRPGA